MNQEKWTDLEKGTCLNHYNFKAGSTQGTGTFSTSINFTQCAFDINDEALVVVDNQGIAYYIDLDEPPAYKRLGCVGLTTFLSFSPFDRNELIVGLSSTNIKVLKINSINDFCSLTGHTAVPMSISFYKDYCLTVSSKEVLVWQAKTFCKVHQLRLNAKNITIKKGTISSIGLVAVLYQTNIIQSWVFQQFNTDNRLDVEKYGLSTVKDFEFTKDGRAMIVCGSQNKILVFNTSRWDLLKCIDLMHDKFPGGRQISVVPLPFDGGANSIVATLTTDCTMRLISLITSNIIENCCELENGIKKFAVSNKGCYLAYITKHGFLDIMLLDKLINKKLGYTNSSSSASAHAEKSKEKFKSSSQHKAEEQLKSVQGAVKEELQLQRLLPILKEYGEYPEKHRILIWETIMELPNNRKAYIELSNKVPHEAMFKLLKNDPLLDKCKSSLLGTTLSCLLHWCSVLEETLFLPRLVLPFTNVFEKNPVLVFEATLFILMNYCQKWFEYHPLPPLNILGIVENVLLEADPLLFNHFCECGASSTIYVWPLLQSMMSEVLNTNDWLILWDHLLSLRKPWFLLLCAVAYNILYRKTIMTKLRSINDLQQFYKTQGHISVKSILKIANKLDCETPHRIHPHRYLKTEIDVIPKKGPYLPFLHFEFPKYLTDELRGINVKKLQKKERRLRGFQLHAMELLEEKRLRAESEYFVKSIHEKRIHEVRKCYENQVHTDERLLEYAKKESEDLDPSKYLHDDDDIKWSDLSYSDRSKCACGMKLEKKKKKSKKIIKDGKSLQEQVDRLEFEVQNLLTVLHKAQKRTKSRIK